MSVGINSFSVKNFLYIEVLRVVFHAVSLCDISAKWSVKHRAKTQLEWLEGGGQR